MNIKTSLITAIMFAITFLSNCFAAVPNGIWYKTDGVITNELRIFFDSPEKLDGKLFYGSYSDLAGSACYYYEFGKPEISGNTAKMKAYLYVDYSDDEDDGIISCDKVVDCIVVFNENNREIKFSVADGENNTFTDSDKCSAIVCTGNNVNVRKSPVSGEKVKTCKKGYTDLFRTIVSAPDYSGIWYGIQLPYGEKGYVSSKYFVARPLKALDIPSDALTHTYKHLFKGKNRKEDLLTTVDFISNGKYVMVCIGEGYINDDWAIPKVNYYLGIVNANMIILNQHIGSMREGADEIFESGDFEQAKVNARPLDNIQTWYYWEHAMYKDGVEYNINY